jgi:hypothetical protein
MRAAQSVQSLNSTEALMKLLLVLSSLLFASPLYASELFEISAGLSLGRCVQDSNKPNDCEYGLPKMQQIKISLISEEGSAPEGEHEYFVESDGAHFLATITVEKRANEVTHKPEYHLSLMLTSFVVGNDSKNVAYNYITVSDASQLNYITLAGPEQKMGKVWFHPILSIGPANEVH